MHQSSFFEKWGRVVAGRRSKWITLAVWVILVALMTVVFPSVNKQENNNAAVLPNEAQSVQAMKEMKKAFPDNSGQPALVVWYNKNGLTNTELKSIQSVTASLEQTPLDAQKSVVPLNKMPIQALKGFESKDGTTLVMPVSFKSGAGTTVLEKSVKKLKEQIKTSAGSAVLSSKLTASGLHVRITGPVGIAVDAQGLFKNADFTLLASTGLLVLVLLILLYRSPILALVPLVSVGFAYGVISPLLGALAKSGMITVDAQSVSIMTVLLFGAGTDYCLFLVSRYREQLMLERDKYKAMRHAVGGAAGAIAMSGLTVAVSLLTLLFAKYGSDHRFAIPFTAAILIMGLVGVTLVPALLAIFGRASFFPFIPRTTEMEEQRKKPRRANRNGGRQARWNGRIVTKRPWSVVIVTVIALGVLAGFAGQIKPTYNLLSSFPKDMPSRQGFQLLSSHFSKGTLAPVQVIVKTSKSGTTVQSRLAKLPFVESASKPKASTVVPEVKLINVTLKQDPYSRQSANDIPAIKSAAEAGLKASGESLSASKVQIAGETATEYDSLQYTNQDTKTVIPIVIIVIALLLLVYLRSVTAMVYLMGTVLLSYYSALGLGWVLLHYIAGVSAIAGAIPLYSFVFLVALGEDYNIFMVSRIWQLSKTTDLPTAISEGVSKTSGVITSAGLILAGTFAVLASLPLQILVQFGTVAALGVLIDTFIVRPFLVPSITSILGRWSFWPGPGPSRNASTTGTKNN
ncbi:MMPL family transporter [Alicyclobacillus sp. SO9]|uniref:MMPL family transporter n=1 Tax=Alicyclobacillus sp. SO9 TaxID=2665646 RepID=UPI0018E7AA14|nr:MMPL family transporter [Alicyclobacillus sp. SO9]QQE78924.1 MMPL family transporter [Alicyclobacillus sp. SO9]